MPFVPKRIAGFQPNFDGSFAVCGVVVVGAMVVHDRTKYDNITAKSFDLRFVLKFNNGRRIVAKRQTRSSLVHDAVQTFRAGGIAIDTVYLTGGQYPNF